MARSVDFPLPKPEEAMAESPFSQGVTFRGSIDLSSNLFGLSQTDSVMAAISDQKGTDFESLPDLSKFATPAFKASVIKAFITKAMFGQDAQVYLPVALRLNVRLRPLAKITAV